MKLLKIYNCVFDKRMAIVITDTIESVEYEMQKRYGAVQYEIQNVSGWTDFKVLFDTDNWPDLFKYNEIGMFDDDSFALACEFVQLGLPAIIKIVRPDFIGPFKTSLN